jgi:hypothetical protein
MNEFGFFISSNEKNQGNVHVSHKEKVQFSPLNFGVRPFFLPEL